MNLRLLEKFGVINFTLLTSLFVTLMSLILALIVNSLIQRPITYQTFILATTVPFAISMPLIYSHFRIAENLRFNNQELEKAMEEIKTLKGIIPICSHCKQIRDDKGFWNKVEEYIEHHSDAKFSHGVCPDCRTKHYSEYIKE